MAKLTKKAIVALHDDIENVLELEFEPKVDMGLTVPKLEVALYQSVLDIELEDKEIKTLSAASQKTIAAMAKNNPEMTVTPDVEEAEAEEVEEAEEAPKKEKKAKKEKKSKKAKAEKPAKEEVEEEAPAPKKTKKPAKGKKGNAALIKTIEGAAFKELQAIVKDNEVFAGFPSVGLKTDVFKASLIAVLNGETTVEEVKAEAKAVRDAGKAAAKDKPKKEKKSKKAKEPTLTEQVNAVDDLDELKAICKGNKDAFPGVKGKKFSKLKKLRKAMLEVIVEEAPKKRNVLSGEARTKKLTETRELREKQIAFLTKTITKAGSINRKDLTAKGIEEFPEDAKGIRDLISYGKNEKYNKFEKLLVEDEGVISFEGAKKSKKAKAEKPAKTEKPAKEKKEKKAKKDKKKK